MSIVIESRCNFLSQYPVLPHAHFRRTPHSRDRPKSTVQGNNTELEIACEMNVDYGPRGGRHVRGNNAITPNDP